MRKRKQVTCGCPRFWFPHRFEPGKCWEFAEPVEPSHIRKRRAAWEEFEDEIPF